MRLMFRPIFDQFIVFKSGLTFVCKQNCSCPIRCECKEICRLDQNKNRHKHTQTNTNRHKQTQTNTSRHTQTESDTNRPKQIKTNLNRPKQTRFHMHTRLMFLIYLSGWTSAMLKTGPIACVPVVMKILVVNIGI